MEGSNDNPLLFLLKDNDISTFTEEPTVANTVQVKSNKIPWLPLVSILLFVVVYVSPIWEDDPISHSCLSLLVFASFLWGTEGIPAFATSYLVPLFSVWLGLGYDENTGERIPASKLASELSWRFMDPVIFLFLGSMTMGAALTKLNITDRVSSFVFKRLSKNPGYILLSLMFLNYGIAAFLSNAASTTLVLSFTMPIIRSLDPDDPYVKALLFGIGWSGNCGGMATTISSAQNIMAVKFIQDNYGKTLSFVEWVLFAIPCSSLFLFIEWYYLLKRFTPQRTQIVVLDKGSDYEGWGLKHTFACLISALTIVLWTIHDSFSSVLGNVGITSMIPVICFFGSGILNITDFHTIRWSTLALIGGGLSLGEVMRTSGLLKLISMSLGPMLQGIPFYPMFILTLVLIGLFASLMNSASAAAIMYPIVSILGSLSHKPVFFVAMTGLMISASQLFHISSFGNALVYGVCRHKLGAPDLVTQTTFLEGSEFFIYSWPTLFISITIFGTLGYGILSIVDV